MFGPIKNLIFDFDGTLVDSMSSVLEGLGNAVSDHLGKEVDDLELLKSFGPAPQEVLRKWLPEEKVDSAFAQWRAFEHARKPEDFAPFDGIEKMLQSLKDANYSIGIFTGRDRPGTLRIAKAHGWLDKYFSEEHMVCGDDGFRAKPEPDALIELLKRNQWDAKLSLMTGDHPYDVMAGRAAGLKTAAVLWDLPKGRGTHRSKFKAGWQRWDTVEVDLRLLQPQSLTEWLVSK